MRMLPRLLVAGLAMSVAAGRVSAAVPSTASPVAAQLLQYLGFSAGDRDSVLEKGGVLHSALISDQQSPEEVVAVGALLLLSAANADAVIDVLLHEDTFHEVHGITRYKLLAEDARGTDQFAGLPVDSIGDVSRIGADPLAVLNLAAAESKAFRIGRNAANPQLQISRAMAGVLAQRLASYVTQGLSGIAQYDRTKGASVRPDRELESALRSLAFLDAEYPAFANNLRTARTVGTVRQRFFRLETQLQGANVISLSRELRQDLPGRAIGADVHFYASRGYNAMLTLFGVVAYDKRWLVFAINHTFTDQVLGFGESLKRSVARKEIAARLARHLEAVRTKVKDPR